MERPYEIVFKELSRILKNGASMIVFMSILRVETLVEIANEFGFYYKTTGIWHKTNPIPRNMNLHFVNSNECWIYFTSKTKTGTFNNKGKLVLDYIETSVTTAREKKLGKHPTQKPIILFEHFIRLLSNEGDLVVDPFLGSGSSAIASYRLNRNFIGVELEEKYAKLANMRVEDEKTSYWFFFGVGGLSKEFFDSGFEIVLANEVDYSIANFYKKIILKWKWLMKIFQN